MDGGGDVHPTDIEKSADSDHITDKKPLSNGNSNKHHDREKSDKHKSDRHKSERRDKDRDRHSSSKHSSDKHRSSSSSKHHSSSSSKDRTHSSSKDKHRDKDKSSSHHSSSSSSHKSSHRDKHHSSSSSSHKSSRRDKDKDRHRDKDRESKLEKVREAVKEEPVEVKEEYDADVSTMTNGDASRVEVDEIPVKIEAVVKEEEESMEAESEGEISQAAVKREKAERKSYKEESDDEEDLPLAARMQKKEVGKDSKKAVKRKQEESAFSPTAKRKKSEQSKSKASVKRESSGGDALQTSPKKGRKKTEEETTERWKWWEEKGKEEGVKWKFLEHKGPMFAPPYEELPDDVHFIYNGKKMRLCAEAEEVAGFFARMIEHEYTTKKIFRDNFMKDWKKVMTAEEKEVITDLSKCNFNQIHAYFKRKSEERKAMSKEEKKAIKEGKDKLAAEYGFCVMDGHKEKIANFNIEPPGLFRGRGNHPKMGMHKRRVRPEDVIINCSKDSKFPKPPPGHKWKEIRHDNTVGWLAGWIENVQNQNKYIMLAANSKLKGEKDWKKYEVARKLHAKVDKIRACYRDDMKSKEMRIRQRAVAMYFIDKLALRAGNEKDTDEVADTVGCCSLRFEHVKLYEEKEGKQNVVEFDFLGKDSIRYFNSMAVDKRVFKNLKMFLDNKNPGDDLFDRLNTSILNAHLSTLMEGLTAKVFRTYNASRTLQEQLDLLTVPEDSLPQKILAYNRANRSVAILCNHQRAVSKTFGKQMENLQNKIDTKKETIQDARKEYKQAKADHKAMKTERTLAIAEKKKKAVERLENQLTKLEIQLTDKDENKDIALGTSKLNYLDPRITVAWCKKWEVPIEKVYNKTQREKFAWAIDMAGAEYKFTEMDDMTEEEDD